MMEGRWHGRNFQNRHRNKRRSTLNLKAPDGVAILQEDGSRTAEVVIENTGPDVKFRLGIDYETVSAINKRIVYGSIFRIRRGRQQSISRSVRVWTTRCAKAMGGLMSITGLRGRPGARRLFRSDLGAPGFSAPWEFPGRIAWSARFPAKASGAVVDARRENLRCWISRRAMGDSKGRYRPGTGKTSTRHSTGVVPDERWQITTVKLPASTSLTRFCQTSVWPNFA